MPAPSPPRREEGISNHKPIGGDAANTPTPTTRLQRRRQALIIATHDTDRHRRGSSKAPQPHCRTPVIAASERAVVQSAQTSPRPRCWTPIIAATAPRRRSCSWRARSRFELRAPAQDLQHGSPAHHEPPDDKAQAHSTTPTNPNAHKRTTNSTTVATPKMTTPRPIDAPQDDTPGNDSTVPTPEVTTPPLQPVTKCPRPSPWQSHKRPK